MVLWPMIRSPQKSNEAFRLKPAGFVAPVQ